jgi:hypothetical protein
LQTKFLSGSPTVAKRHRSIAKRRAAATMSRRLPRRFEGRFRV